MRDILRNTPRTGPPDPLRQPSRHPRPPFPLATAGLAAVAALGIWLGLTWPVGGRSSAPEASIARFEPPSYVAGIPGGNIDALSGQARDQMATVTPEETEEPPPVTVTPEGSEEPPPVTVTPEETGEPGPITTTPESTDEGTANATPTSTPTPTPSSTRTPTPGMTCTPPPCPCGQLVGICPNIRCVGTCTPKPPTSTATPTPGAGTFSNISTRSRVGAGANVLIGGFIIRGSPVKVILRAIGPSMGQPPSNVPGTLPNPLLQLYSGQTVIASNDDWQSGNCGTEAPAGLRPKDPRESCLVITLSSGPYTAIVSGGGGTGVALVEVFHAGGAGELSNISTRSDVRAGDNVMIGGFIIRSAPVKVILRAIGPSMGLPPNNVPGTLPNPQIQLYSGQTVIAHNDDWQSGNCGTEAPVGLRPSDPRESCLVITLAPGPYTAIVSGVGGATGVGLVEVFKAGP